MDKHWAAHLEALAETDQPKAAFKSLETVIQENVGAILFTAMIHDFKEGRARRIYSNRDDAYPTGGWKPIQKNRYFATVVEGHKPFINHNRDDIVDQFFDHELILSLGCESSCHIPIIADGAVVGVFNMLNVAGHYTEERLQRALDLRPFAIGPMFLARKYHGVW